MWLALAAMAFAQVAILQIKVVEGEGAVHLPGARSPRPLTVEVTDETGRPVAGAAVSFHLPEDGPGGSLRQRPAHRDRDHRFPRPRQSARPAGEPVPVDASNCGSWRPKSRRAPASCLFNMWPRPRAARAAAAAAASHRKWIVIGAGIAGGAVAGLIASRGGSAAAAAAAPAVAPSPALTIGAPAITVGKP